MFINKEKIEVYLAKQCMSYNDLSKASGISRITIQKMIYNKVNARPVTIGKIAKALQVPVTDIIETTAATVNQEK